MTAYELKQDDLLKDAGISLTVAADLLELASAVMMANGFLSAGGMASALVVQLVEVAEHLYDLTGMTEIDDVEAVKVRASQYISGYLAMQKKKNEKKKEED